MTKTSNLKKPLSIAILVSLFAFLSTVGSQSDLGDSKNLLDGNVKFDYSYNQLEKVAKSLSEDNF